MENTVFIIHQLYLFCHSTAGSELRAQGPPDPAGSPHGPAGEQPGRAAPRPPPHPTPEFCVNGGEEAAERSEGRSTGLGRRTGLQVKSWAPWEMLGEVPAPASSPWSPAPVSLASWGIRGAQHPGRESGGGERGEWGGGGETGCHFGSCAGRAAAPASAHRELPGARRAPRGRAGRGLTFVGNPAGRDGDADRSGPRAQRDLHGWPLRRRRLSAAASSSSEGGKYSFCADLRGEASMSPLTFAFK